MLELDGIKFRTQEEYDLACKDKETILRLKRLFDINTDEGLKNLYSELQAVNFSSEIGRRFDDEIFELYSNMKKGIKYPFSYSATHIHFFSQFRLLAMPSAMRRGPYHKSICLLCRPAQSCIL